MRRTNVYRIMEAKMHPACAVKLNAHSLAILLAVSASALADQAPRLYSEVPAIRHGKAVLWHDPGAVETKDLQDCGGGRSGAPRPSFTFVKEDEAGTNAKLHVRDSAGRNWAVKFGPEASPDTFATGLACVLGYYVEPTYYIADGIILSAHDLKRTKHFIGPNGQFHGGRFQLRTKHPEFLKDVDWSWSQNPFVGTHALNGLKILMMLTSNWDSKDIRDATDRGSNTAVYRMGRRYIFFVDDWGAAMGAWGNLATRSKWNAGDYGEQTKEFVRGIKDGEIEWGYHGAHTADMTRGIQVSDVRWLLRYLGRVSDRQVAAGLRASGASDKEVSMYIASIRLRIQQLQRVATSASAPKMISKTAAAR
jgi:hypothetical protein